MELPIKSNLLLLLIKNKEVKHIGKFQLHSDRTLHGLKAWNHDRCTLFWVLTICIIFLFDGFAYM